MANAKIAIEYVISNEIVGTKTYLDDPDDDGLATNYGVSLRFLRSLSLPQLKKVEITDFPPTTDTIKAIDEAKAEEIFLTFFWNLNANLQFVSIQQVANYLLDGIVLMGSYNAIVCAQRAVWAFCASQNALSDDGVLGGKTLDQINTAGNLIMPALRSERANYHRRIVIADPKKKKFLDNWLRRAYK